MIFAYFMTILLLGLVVGSFLNVCILRIPKNESIMLPSRCPCCNSRLKPFDLVPILSYVFLNGQCRYCGSKINLRYCIVEFVTPVFFLMLFYKYGFSVEFLISSYFVSVLIIVFFIDMDNLIIPNHLVLAALLGGIALFVYSLFFKTPIYGSNAALWSPLAGMVAGSGFLFLVAVIGFLIYKTNEAMGIGDVKFLASIGLFLGFELTVLTLFLAVFLSCLASIALILFKKKKSKDTIPFGPFISTGAFISLMWGWDIIELYRILSDKIINGLWGI